MLTKTEMKKFAEQFITGKIKIRKNTPVYGKSDTYHVSNNNVFIHFEDNIINLKVPNVSLFMENTNDLTPKMSNYIVTANKLVKIENIARGDDIPRVLDGQLYTELSFKVVKKEISLSVFKLISYYAIKERTTSFGLIFYDLPYYNNYSSHLVINIESNNKISCDFDMFKLPIVNEVLDFDYLLDDVFNDQLNTLEMALL